MKLFANVPMGNVITINESQLREILSEQLLLEASLDDIYKKYYSDVNLNDFWSLIKADPTYDENNPQKMGKFGKWLILQYKQGKLKIEDLYKVTESLEAFVRFNNRIEIKDINRYKNASELYDVVKPFIDNPEQATSKSDETRRLKEGAEKVYEDNEWLILIPKTKEAAIYYGKGTRWCTAAERGQNYFDYYNKDGNLYININKTDGEKYQFHFESDSFMDSSDTPIEGIIADTIGLSEGAKRFYYSISQSTGEEICENEHSEEEEYEEETVLNENGWLVTYNSDMGALYIRNEDDNNYEIESYEMEVYNGRLTNYYGNVIDAPFYQIFPPNVIASFYDYVQNDVFIIGILGFRNVKAYYLNSGYYLITDKDNKNLMVYSYDDDTYVPTCEYDLRKYDIYLSDDDIKYYNERHAKVTLKVSKEGTNEHWLFSLSEGNFLFDQPIENICYQTTRKTCAIATNGNGLIYYIIDDENFESTYYEIPKPNNENITELDLYHQIAIVNVGQKYSERIKNSDTKLRFYMYSIPQKKYINDVVFDGILFRNNNIFGLYNVDKNIEDRIRYDGDNTKKWMSQHSHSKDEELLDSIIKKTTDYQICNSDPDKGEIFYPNGVDKISRKDYLTQLGVYKEVSYLWKKYHKDEIVNNDSEDEMLF
jgi:hypothetical protein